MDEKRTSQIKTATSLLSRAEQNNSTASMKAGYKRIKNLVNAVYNENTGVPAVLQIEQMLNDGNANVLGNSAEAYDRMKELSRKAGLGLKQYAVMCGNPGNYVAVADMTRAGIGSSPGEPRVAPESVAYDPVRAALTQFRKELLKELTNRKVDKHPDNRHTNMLRFMATIRAERSYLEEYLAARHTEKKDAKKKHLEDFDKRMEKLTRKIEPPQ